MKILLVGMYPADQQYSLQGFTGALQAGLSARGCDVRVITPRAVLGSVKVPLAGKWLGHADKFALFPQTLRRAARWADVVHLVDHGHAVYVKHLHNVPHVITCNDLIAAKAAHGELPEWALTGTARVYQQMILQGLRQAQQIVCISEATRRDVVRLAGVPENKTALVYDALFHAYKPMPENESAALLAGLNISLNEPFLLHIGRDAPTKNRRGLVQIFRNLRENSGRADLRLVLAGKPLSDEMRQFIRECGVAGAVVERSDLRDEQLRALYSRAAAFVFPSLCEGFGLPIIEAQACGCPVFTSDRAPMTEVGGDAACYFDPARPDAAACIIAERLAQPGGRAAMQAAGLTNVQRFTSEKMLDGYQRVYEHVLRERQA